MKAYTKHLFAVFAAACILSQANGAYGLGYMTAHMTLSGTGDVMEVSLSATSSSAMVGISMTFDTGVTTMMGPIKEAYLRRNAIALQEDLVLGAGETVRDFAAYLSVANEEYDWFGRIIRRHRHELLDLAAPERLTPERALAFFDAVEALFFEHTCPSYASDVPTRTAR
ncbi:MAG: hypothetical protein ACNA8W_23675 [Bradymonadaceae bacterium]